MVSSIGYALGIGSGIDTAKLIDDLYAASKAPKEIAIKKREEANAAKVSALGQASGAISSFSTALSALISGGALYTQPTVSDTSIFTAKALPGSRLGDFSGRLEVRQLAQAQSLVSAPLADSAAPVGQGKLTLTIGTETHEITIGEGNNSLKGLADAINAKKAGVTATIVTEAGASKLMLKGATGEEKAFTLSVPEGTDTGLERFAFGPSVTDGLTQAQAARDAILVLDGVEIRRNGNAVTDVIPGVQLDLAKAVPGTTVAIGSQRPTEAINQAVGDFVAAFNELLSVVSELSGAGVPGQESGPLRQDVGIREMKRSLTRLPSVELRQGEGPRTLADIGVRTNRDGTLSVDSAKLKDMLAKFPDAVEGMFNPTQYSSDPNITIMNKLGSLKPGTYKITDVMPGVNGGNATARINGTLITGSGDYIIPPYTHAAAGMNIKITGAVANATIVVEPGLHGALAAIKDALFASNGPLQTSQKRLGDDAKGIQDDRRKMEQRATAYRDQLVKNFTAMEKRVSAFKATQTYLEQQVKMWTNSRD